MRKLGDFELDAWYKLEVNLHRIRRELIKLLESSEANECFVCNKLRCCCSASNRSSTLSCLTSLSSNQSIKSYHSNQSSSSTNSIEDTPVPPPALSLPKPEWKSKNVADWIRASTSTPIDAMNQDKHFFNMDATDTESMFKIHNISLQQVNKPYKSLNYLSKSVPNIKQSYMIKKKIEVPEAVGHHIMMNNYWPKSIRDEMTKLDGVTWPMRGQRNLNSVQAFFRSFSEVTGGSVANTNRYSYF